MTLRRTLWMPVLLGLAAIGMSGLGLAAPPGGGGKVTPTLTVTVSPGTIAEGQTATGTVSRVNASLSSSSEVTLKIFVGTTEDRTEAEFAPPDPDNVITVTIDAEATSTTFTVKGVNDGTGDGAKTVTITASATGFKSGSVNVTAATPALPPVQYRVQFIPTPANAHLQDVNDSHQAVGWFSQSTNEGSMNTGFYYDAASSPPTYLTATDMLPPELTGSTQFIGINNWGWIVGSLADSNGLRRGILIYPTTATPSGWDYEVVYGPVDAYDYYPRDINDFGDIVGLYWRRNADGTRGLADAFAYNPGVPLVSEYLEPTPFGLAEAHGYSIQVSNQRRGLATENATGDGLWFNFVAHLREPVVVPEPYYINVTGLNNPILSNDGQLAVARIASRTKVKGSYTYTYRPGVVRDGALVWEGDFEGQTGFVNSAAPGNQVGDAVGWSSGFSTPWLQHADWGKLNIESMLVFARNTSDQERWLLGNPSERRMSDRDSTGFGMVAGSLEESGGSSLFVLIPETFTAP